MKIKIVLILLVTHLFVGAFGFALGIYALPILIAPEPPTTAELNEMSAQAAYSGQFKRDLKDSDSLHWGEGKVSIGSQFITLDGKLAPGPDYKLYLSAEFIETEADFKRLKSTMLRVGDIKTFDNFVLQVSSGIDISAYNTVIIWCETFGEFITSAKYQ